jgi:hypothetical protein
MADRDLGAWLEEVELQQLAGTVERALGGAPGLEQRAHLAQVAVENGLPALISEPCKQLSHTLAGQVRILAQQAVDLVLEGIQLRRPWWTLIARRTLGPERTADSVSVVPGAPGDLPDREPVDLLHPPDLRPAPHVKHRPPLASVLDLARVRVTPDETDNH